MLAVRGFEVGGEAGLEKAPMTLGQRCGPGCDERRGIDGREPAFVDIATQMLPHPARFGASVIEGIAAKAFGHTPEK